MTRRGVPFRVALAWALGCTACSAEPATPHPPTPAHPCASASLVEASAEPVAPPSASALELAQSAPLPREIAPLLPESEPTEAPLPAPTASVAPLGPFDVARLPKTKLALIQSVDSALRSGDAARLGEVSLDARAVDEHCPAQPAGSTLASELERGRERTAEGFAECLALVDWSKARYLVLNYGSRLMGADETCPGWSRHESSELFYGVGDEVYKVKLGGARATPRGHALGGSIRCSKKGGSADEMLQGAGRFGQTCPGQPWPVLTQVRGPCPRLK